MFPELQTEYLVLREIQSEDREALFAIFSSPQVIRYYGQEKLENLEQADDMKVTFEKMFEEKRGVRWGIERKETSGLIGTIGFHLWNAKHKRAEIGYELLPDFWGKGYASEVVAEIVKFGFQTMNLTRVGAVVFTENTASAKVLTKNKFKVEGVLRDYMYQSGRAHDATVFSVLKSEFDGMK